MKIEHKHNLPIDVTYTRINKLLHELQDQYSDKISDPHKRWNSSHTQMDFSIEIMGFKTYGQIYLKKHLVILEGKLPFMAIIFSGKIESMIKEKFDELLS
ncbi:MAG: polyhydroxyalkanoic acid system family protein [Nanoarchaeota archaeon]